MRLSIGCRDPEGTSPDHGTHPGEGYYSAYPASLNTHSNRRVVAGLVLATPIVPSEVFARFGASESASRRHAERARVVEVIRRGQGRDL